MDDLDFRKYLTEHGITKEEFEGMTQDKKKEIETRFKFENRGKKMQSAGKAMQNTGCSLMLLPLLLIFLFIIWFLAQLI